MFKKKLSKFYFTFAFLFALIGLSFATNATAENEPDNYVQLRVFANQTKVTGGETIRLGLEQTIYPQWHTYWLNPGDSGLAFSVDWDLPEGYSVSNLEWPTPQKIPYGELTNYGYGGQVILLQNLTLPETVTTEPITIKGKTSLLVCHDICIPETHDVEITLNGDKAAHPERIKTAEEKIPTTLENTAHFHQQGENFIIDIDGLENNLDTNSNFLAPEEWGLIDNNASAVIEQTKTGYRINQKIGARELSEVKEYPVVVTSLNGGAYRFIATPMVENSAAVVPAVANETSVPITFIKAFIFALLGGLVLNLMPCVFPVLSMKALSLVQMSGKEENKARLYGLSYSAGIMISFGLIAAILMTLKSAGAEIGWGFQLQNPIVISLLAYLIFIIGLNLAGLFEFSNQFSNVGQKLTHKSGNKGAFFTGVLATLVATPCTAPFMGVAMGYALTQGAFVSLIIFLALGFGLALPYLALCFVPALRAKLPKPGAWMERFKQFLSFPMFLTVAFLIWVLSQQAGSVSVLLILSAMIAITFVIWLWRAMPPKGLTRLISFIVIAIAALFIIGAPIMLESNTAPNMQNEQSFSHEKLDALLQEDEAVFTNMTAAWCITCKVNERVALKTNSTEKLFTDKNIQYLKGDWTNRNAEISQYLNSFNRQGVPLYVYYGPRNTQSGKRPEAVILPQVLTRNIIKETIN